MGAEKHGTCLFVLKVIFSPFILIGWSFAYYFVPCVNAYFRSVWRCICCTAKCCKFKDKKFPPDPRSLGPGSGRADWYPLDELAIWGKGKPGLFPPKIRPSDVQQGGVGNCWLISAFACIAERPGTIQKMFRTNEKSSRGKYSVKIYDRRKQRWERVTVDDQLPCRPGTRQPLYACPSGLECWPMVLEKAFAKYCGSYEGLSGGVTAWAMEAMTGDAVFKVMRERDGSWRRYDLVTPPNACGRRDIGLHPTGEAYSLEKLFDILWEYDRVEALLSASSEAGEDRRDNAVRGIVQGHAYSILRVRKVERSRMVQLRNPWGGFEWPGAWSARTPQWLKYPKVAKALDFTTGAADSKDGVFWMELSDVVQHFRNFDICDRSRGLADLRLDVHEEMGCRGPCYGLCAGCAKFWCRCRGVRRLICGHTSTGETREGRTCCVCCGC